MALTEGPAHLVHGSLLAPEAELGAEHDPVKVRMVRDASGYTYHERRPHLVEGKAGETLTVSRNLAILWASNGRCVLFPVEEPQELAEVEELPPAATEPEPEVQILEVGPPKAPAKKRRRRRK